LTGLDRSQHNLHLFRRLAEAAEAALRTLGADRLCWYSWEPWFYCLEATAYRQKTTREKIDKMKWTQGEQSKQWSRLDKREAARGVITETGHRVIETFLASSALGRT
jgi:hypothetical protein